MAVAAFVGLALMLVSMLMILFYSLVLIVRAFKEGILWGIGYLLVPFVAIIFVIMKWPVAKDPFLKSLLWMGVFAVGAFIAAILGGASATPTAG